MPSRIKSDRTHMDESVLAHCPELQSIPMNKPQLAAIAGGKIYRPQQAGYMFQNLPISKAQKEALLLDFVERSMKTNPITIPAHRYATRVTDKLSVVATSTPPHPPTPVQVADAALAVRDQGNQTTPQGHDQRTQTTEEDQRLQGATVNNPSNREPAVTRQSRSNNPDEYPSYEDQAAKEAQEALEEDNRKAWSASSEGYKLHLENQGRTSILDRKNSKEASQSQTGGLSQTRIHRLSPQQVAPNTAPAAPVRGSGLNAAFGARDALIGARDYSIRSIRGALESVSPRSRIAPAASLNTSPSISDTLIGVPDQWAWPRGSQN